MTEVTQNQLAQLEQSVSVEQIQLSEKLGAIKATAFIKKLVTVTEIKLLSEVKESKQYKGLKIVGDNGKVVTVTTWEQFCNHLGMSCEKIDEDIRNLGAFGEDFLETSQRMGLGYRDLRKLRKLPEEDREVLINGEAVKAEDRESLIDLIEEMSAKHAKEKDQLKARVADLESSDAAKEQIIKTKDQKNNELLEKVAKLESPVEIQKRAETEDQQIELAALDVLKTASNSFLIAFNQYINALGGVLDTAENGHPHLFERVDESIVATAQRYAQYIQSLGVQVDFAEMLSPAWMFPENNDLAAVSAEAED